MSHTYYVQPEARPEQKIVFTSVDQKGGIGPLSQYVIRNSGISVANPTPKNLEKGFHIAEDKGRMLVFIVTVTSKITTTIALEENLGLALDSLGVVKQETSIWFPLMGTGSGGLSYNKSATIIKDVLEERIPIPLSKVIISLPSDLNAQQEIEIEKVFNPFFEPEPKLPDDIESLIERFLQRFPLHELQFMNLESYSNINSRDYFTYWLEHETSAVGGVRGGSSFKFGIFKRRSKETKVSNAKYSYEDDYAWYTQYGPTKEVAFQTILDNIVRTASYAAKGDIKEIGKVSLDSRIKWKIAFLYQNFQKPKVVSIYKKEALRDLSGLPDSTFTVAKAHELLIKKKPKDLDVWTYSKNLWTEWSSNQQNSAEENTIVASQNIPNDQGDYIAEPPSEQEQEEDIVLDDENLQITRFDNDGLAGKDHLGIQNEIEALASIIAYKETTPPLSIGIFGEWGAGKSFYMQQLISRIDEYSQKARDSRLPQRSYPFFKHIKQIKFNAWNYVESDLWASLAHTIYKNLYQSDENKNKKASHWLKIVKYGEEEAKQKEAEIKKLEAESREVENSLNRLKQEKKDTELEKIDDENKVLSAALDPNTSKKCLALLEQLGLKQQVNTINDAISVVNELKTIGNRVNLLFKAVSKTSLLTILFLVLLPFLTFYIFTLLDGIFWENKLVDKIVAFLVFMSTSLAWIKNRINLANEWLNKIEDLQLSTRSLKDRKQEQLAVRKKEANKKLEELDRKIENTKEQKIQIEKQIKQARVNLNDLTPESILAYHISETLGDNRYGKFLGLPAILSRDFEVLSSTIEKQNESLEDINLYPTLNEELNAEDAAHRINRIVLYIDDLDRCEPETVVKVLEAVHLFLASPLFIVVLGVDPRWLFSSIREHYASLMQRGEADHESTLSASTPEEYLEKIFQIPIWLNSPNNENVQRIISSLIGTVRKEESVKQNHTNSDSSSKKNERQHDDKDKSDNKEEHGGSIKRKLNHNDNESSESRETEQLMLAQHHKLESGEVQFISGLSHILGRSPRSVKRYLNIYRLIKSSLSEEDYERFMFSVDDNEEGYKSVSFLLAVVVGNPDIAPTVIKKCNNFETSTSIRKIIESLRAPQQYESQKIDLFIENCEKLDCLDIPLSTIGYWSKVVSRYSYTKM